MAKKDKRLIVALRCEECKNKNYTVYKNKQQTQVKLEVKKFCQTCKAHTSHKETKLK